MPVQVTITEAVSILEKYYCSIAKDYIKGSIYGLYNLEKCSYHDMSTVRKYLAILKYDLWHCIDIKKFICDLQKELGCCFQDISIQFEKIKSPEYTPVVLCECPEEFTLIRETNTCIKHGESSSIPIINPDTFIVIQGDKSASYSNKGLRLAGAGSGNQNIRQDAYFGYDGQSNTEGKLNNVGVWGEDNLGNSIPDHQWTGFSVCLELEEDGDYLLCSAADNRSRIKLNGNLLTESPNQNGLINPDIDDPVTFTGWWVVPIQLTAGKHVLELEGYNNGNIASFGAEIVGPFPAGSISNITDIPTQKAAIITAIDDGIPDSNQGYINNILFTTKNQLGLQFVTNAAYVCPDGTYLSLCDEPKCISNTLEEVPAICE